MVEGLLGRGGGEAEKVKKVEIGNEGIGRRSAGVGEAFGVSSRRAMLTLPERKGGREQEKASARGAGWTDAGREGERVGRAQGCVEGGGGESVIGDRVSL